jgi:hypothetical protein
MPKDLEWVRQNIKEPLNWTDADMLLRVLRERPSARGMVYGFMAEMRFAKWLDSHGISEDTHIVDDDHAKTKSDRTIPYKGKHYTIQVKSMQTNSLADVVPGQFQAKVQCDASDKRKLKLPTGREVETTCYLAGEFMVLATSLHPFERKWDFAFRLNSTLPRSTYYRYDPQDREHLLKTSVDITWPLKEPWTTNLFGLLDGAPDLGEILDEKGSEKQIRLPGTNKTARVAVKKNRRR